MTKILGLTGSIGMGKSTISSQLAEFGAKISDSDAIVHKLFQNKDIIAKIAQEFPETLKQANIDRNILGQLVFANPEKLKILENIIHPMVRAENLKLIEQAKREKWPILVLEIPLLYETGAEEICDAVIVVTTSYDIQHSRVLARNGMTEEKFEQILKQQMSDADKRKRADYIIDTSNGFESSKVQLEVLISKL